MGCGVPECDSQGAELGAFVTGAHDEDSTVSQPPVTSGLASGVSFERRNTQIKRQLEARILSGARGNRNCIGQGGQTPGRKRLGCGELKREMEQE